MSVVQKQQASKAFFRGIYYESDIFDKVLLLSVYYTIMGIKKQSLFFQEQINFLGFFFLKGWHLKKI
jgi:hypothetical protein